MSRTAGRHGLGDPRLPWNVLVQATPGTPVDEECSRLAALAATQGWPAPEPVLRDTPAGLRRRLADARSGCPVHLGLAGSKAGGTAGEAAGAESGKDLVVAGDHAQLDGLALLVVLEALLGSPVRSTARGVGRERPTRSLARAGVRRLGEVLLAPPTLPVASADRPRAHADAFASSEIPGAVRTSALVVAGARGIAADNRLHGARADRISVAVGMSTVGGAAARLADDSCYVRLEHVESATSQQVADAIRTADLQPGGGATSGRLAGPVRRVATMAASRLGSTLLVSHLGTVQAPGLERLAFYPVTGGGSGLSLGAVTLGGTTVLTLRARGARHDDDGLQRLLETIVESLPDSPG